VITNISTPGSRPTDNTDEIKKPSIWIRGLYMLLFIIITRLVEAVIGLVMLIQFILKAASGNINNNLATFGNQLSQYMFAIIQFQTFNSEEKPFPFSEWPKVKQSAE